MDELQRFILSEIREHIGQINELIGELEQESDRIEWHTDKAIKLLNKFEGLEGLPSSTKVT